LSSEEVFERKEEVSGSIRALIQALTRSPRCTPILSF
jgi:hypothetical protein